MIRCPHCDLDTDPAFRFCPGCGQGLYRSCPSCNQELGAWMTFCPHCGSRMDAQPTSVDVAGDSRVQLATVLFGDVKGFTAMSEHLPPEEVTNIMNECFGLLSQAVVQYGGSVDKYVGDAIMARFGWPQAHEDDPVRAIHAGLEMQRALRRFADHLQATRGYALSMRIGINSGQVFAARVGDPNAPFTLMGNTVNLASRLEHEAEPGSVLVGETTYRLSKHAFEFKAMEPMEIRGQTDLIHSFVPVRPKVGASGSRAGRSERQFRLVGRETEISLLDRYLDEARAGQGRLVVLVSDPGLGKSRLVEEFWKRHLDQGLTRIYAAAPSFGESMPYSMLANFIRSFLFREAPDHEITPDELRRSLVDLLPEQRVDDAVAIIGDVLGLEDTRETKVANLEPGSRQAILTEIIKLLLSARSRNGPLLLNLEDMHWVDRASLDIFDQLLTGIQSLPVMALLTHRPAFTRQWSSKTFYREIKLLELTPENAAELLQEFFGDNSIPEEVGQLVIDKAGGNPFFLEQMLNNLVVSGAVVQQSGCWILAGDINTLSVPDTIQEILQARIDQLTRPARAVLETASVIGRIFLRRLLEAVTDTKQVLNDQLLALQQQEFIFEKSVLPEIEFMFTHALTQDVAYNGLPEARRKALHERVAGAIESLGITISNEQVSLLAVHYEKTANRGKALEYAVAAADSARKMYANEDAVSHYEQALQMLEDEPNDDPRRLSILEALADIHWILCQFDKANEFYARARNEASARAVDRSRLWRKTGDLAESQARYADAQSAYREAEAALADVVEPAEQINVWLAVARMHRSRGVLESASTTCLRALSLVGQVTDATSASLYFELGQIERERGHLRSASGYLDAASSTWEQTGAVEKQALVFSALADVSLNRGELQEALQHFGKALEVQQRVLDRQGIASTMYGLGRIRVAMGETDLAIECYTEAMSIANETESRSLAANCMIQLGTLFLEQGDVPRAEALVGEADRAFKKMRNWRGSAHALIARARLHRARGDSDHARQILHRARNLAKELEDPWLQAQVSITEAELEEETGRLDRGADCAQEGINMARDLSDPRLIARGERILGRIRARQGRNREALDLLRGGAWTFKRSGALVDSARASLDYLIVAQSMPDGNLQARRELLSFARDTFERIGSTRELAILQGIAKHMETPAGR